MLTYKSDSNIVDFNRLIELFKEVGWTEKTRDLERLKSMVLNSQIVVTTWDDDLMVGFARCITDYVFNGQINNVVVDPQYRRKGIGKKLIKMILASSEKVSYILRGDPENIEFYKSLEFEEAKLSMIFHREN